MSSTPKWLVATTSIVALLGVTLPAHAGHVSGGPASPTYSIDFQGPTAGLVNAGDILTPAAPGLAPPPTVVIPFGAAGLGLTPVTASGIHAEVDALSYGVDYWIQPTSTPGWQFSVDEFAVGIPTLFGGPSVVTQGASAAGAKEAAADIYGATPATPGAFAPPGIIPPALAGPNFGLFDGNGGTTPFAAPGLNLVEPNAPTVGTLPDVGDNLDAWDVDTHITPTDTGGAFSPPVYYSLDAFFADPLETFPANSGTAALNGFNGADILVSTVAGAGPTVYASALSLGLTDEDQDDVDALVLWENGTSGYQPVTGPYSWIPSAANGGEPTDMLLYSVRRGSFAVGMTDALSGAPIEEGDILVPVETFAGSGVYIPGIFIPAEALGLATVRSGTATTYAGIFNPDAGGLPLWADDLDALDVVAFIPEPATAMLLLAGLTLSIYRRRR